MSNTPLNAPAGTEKTPEGIIAKDQTDSEKKIAQQEIWKIENKEIARILEAYLLDSERTDVQAALLNKEGRKRLLEEAAKISQIAKKSTIDLLQRGVKDKTMERTQADVDDLANKIKQKGSKLYDNGKFPGPENADYWAKEDAHAKTRRASTDKRWKAWNKEYPEHRKATESLLAEAKKIENALREFFTKILQKAEIPESNAMTSTRIKSPKSLFNKVEKFRKSPWGAQATIADAFDIAGGRIVVNDLKTLEKLTDTFEEMIDQWPRAKILRKENKFIVNDEKPEPYRAMQYTVAIAGENGTMHSCEIQFKTYSSMITSDLLHNAVYKPDVLNLHDQLRDAVRAYSWEATCNEMADYLGIQKRDYKEMDIDTQIEEAIATGDYNAFYDLVLDKIDPKEPLDGKTKNQIKRFHEKEAEKLRQLKNTDEALFMKLMTAAHESYFDQTAQDVLSPQKYRNSLQLGNKLPDAAVALLPESGKNCYEKRFENFNGRNNKLSAKNLGLLEMTAEQRKKFFETAGKDTSSKKIADFLALTEENPEKAGAAYIMNLYHGHFAELREIGKNIKNPDARTAWNQTIIDNQIGAVASSSILTEINDKNANGIERDLSAAAVGLYSKREMHTFLLWIAAINPGSEFADKSYAEFVTAESSAWARDYDKKMDRDIMRTLSIVQMDMLEAKIAQENDPVLLARLHKSRIEILQKYAKAMMPNAQATKLIEGYFQNEVLAKQIPVLLREYDPRTAKVIESTQKSAKASNMKHLIDCIHTQKPENEIFEQLLMSVNDPEFLKNHIFQELESAMVEGDFKKIKRVVELAEKGHEEQMRDEGTPYILHPLRIMIRLIRAGQKDVKTLSIAALHDILEDTDIDLTKMAELFEPGVVETVIKLSKKRDGEKVSREQYFSELGTAENEIKRIKIYDRIDNLYSLRFTTKKGKKANYIKDTRDYVSGLATFDPELQQELERALKSTETEPCGICGSELHASEDCLLRITKKIVIDGDEIECEEVDFNREFGEALKTAEKYRKKVVVDARQATKHELISTGQDGMQNWADLGDWIIRNPGDQDEYVFGNKGNKKDTLSVRQSKFSEKYDTIEGQPGKFKAKGVIRAMRVGKNFIFKTSWGEEMAVKAGGWVADGGYCIAEKSFENTYEKIEA